MSSLKYFEQIDLENVAGTLIDGKLWFIGKDAAKALKYPRVTKALKDHVDVEDMCKISFQDAKGRWVDATVINESGLFSLVFSSQLSSTKEFKRWITKEVLPQIRKTGGYISLSDEDNEKTINEKASQIAQKTIAHYVELEKSLREKVAFAERIQKSDENILVRVFAKLLSGDNFTIGETDLFTWFKARKYLMKNNEPYQKYIDQGVLLYAEREIPTEHGLRLEYTTLITPKGQQYFFDKILEDIENGKFSI